MGKITRIDLFVNIDEYMAFLEWAKTKNPQTKADMVRLLADYKSPDLIVDAHPERVEHEIVKNFKAMDVRQQKGT